MGPRTNCIDAAIISSHCLRNFSIRGGVHRQNECILTTIAGVSQLQPTLNATGRAWLFKGGRISGMMTAAEKRKFLGSLGALMDEYTGRVTGTMDLTFVAAAPDGDDEDIQLTFPDWACITSTQG
jgi:hypothetical protein